MSLASTIDEIADAYRAAGVQPGEMLLIHSGVGRTIRKARHQAREFGVADIIKAFQLAVGPDGTLLFPLFNFDFTQGVPFDIRTTPSHMGILTETARAMPQAVRTGHPIYGFAALGAQAAKFETVNNKSGYGPDSPFAILHQAGGRIGVIDLPENDSVTFYHYVEETHSVPYRYHKTWTGSYTDAQGKMTEREYGIYVRDIGQKVETMVDPMGEWLWAQGSYDGDRPGEGWGLRTIPASRLFDLTTDVIRAGRAEGLLYRRGE